MAKGLNGRVSPWTILLALAVALSPVGAVRAVEVPFDDAGAAIDLGFSGAAAVVLGDLDRDGDLDAVAAGEIADEVAWWSNDGGSWTKESIASSFGGATDVQVADLDGDGDLDVLGAAQDDDLVVWWENDGLGTWSAETVDATFTGPTTLFTGDLDGDGDLDILGGSYDGDEIAWWENDGLGTWSKTVVGSSFDKPVSVHAADLDGDNDLDVLGASEGLGADLTWWENTDGVGGSWTQTNLNSPSLWYGATCVSAADLDRDGDLDVISMGVTIYDDQVIWWENLGGAPLTWLDHEVDATFETGESVTAVDLDRDSDLDLVGVGSDFGEITWWENDGDAASWTEHRINDTTFAGGCSAAVGDLDGDGDLDVVGAARLAHDLRWWENEAIHRTALYPIEIPILNAFNGAAAIHAADIDMDGDPDLLGAAHTDGMVAWWADDGAGTWIQEVVTATLPGVIAVDTADFDGDADLDVLAAGSVDGSIIWYERDSSIDPVTWYEHEVNQVATDPFDGVSSVRVVDMDGDGDPDVVGSSATLDAVAWWENDGSGVFYPSVTLSAGFPGASSVWTADLDRDGDPDVLGASLLGDEVAWWENLGSGVFGARTTIEAGFPGARTVRSDDVNRDGAPDVLAGADAGAELAWWAGDGAGGFGPRQSVDATVIGASSVWSADLDQDGDLDLVATADSPTGELIWYEDVAGDGSAWTRHDIHDAFPGASCVRGADLDLDGDLDLVATASTMSEVFLWENLGGHFSFTTAQTAPEPLIQGTTDDILSIQPLHLGRTGDTALELVNFRLRFELSPGRALTNTEANALIETLYIYIDDGSGVFDVPDALVMTDTYLSLSSGQLHVPLPSNDWRSQVPFGSSVLYFVVVEMTADAQIQFPYRFMISHQTDPVYSNISRAEDDDWSPDLELVMEYTLDFSSEVLEIGTEHAAETFYGAQQVIALDLDGDGDQDLLGAATAPSDSITWWENLYGRGMNWVEHGVDLAFSGANSVAMGDLDSDGDLDVLGTAGDATDEIAWWENDGAGTWTKESVVTAFDGASSVLAVDLDLDGDLDVLGSAADDGEISWFENDGLGTWTEEVIGSGFAGAAEVSAADLDGDGDPDVLGVAATDGEITFWENRLRDALPWLEQTVDATFLGAASLCTSDLDRDGDLDILGAAATDSHVTWWENPGALGPAWVEHLVSDLFQQPQSIRAVDMDQDGDPDILSGSYNSDSLVGDVTWWENDGTGSTWTEHQVDSEFDETRWVTTADLDGDGDHDVLGVAEVSGNVRWWNNDTIHRNAVFDERTVVDGSFGAAQSACGADLDGDADLDVLAAAWGDSEVAAWDNTDGIGGSWSKTSIDAGYNKAAWVDSGDIDRDGDPDLVAAADWGDEIAWWAGDGTGAFGSKQTIASGFDGANFVQLADLNGDGALDVLATAWNGGEIAWWAGDGTGSFGSKQSVDAAFTAPTSAFAVDLDGDGDLDVAGTSYIGDTLGWWENTDGAGSFGSYFGVVYNFDGATSVYAADLDGDGDNDLLGTAYNDQEITWWENYDGLGTAWNQNQLDITFGGATDALSTDLDLDGDLDIAGTGYVDDVVAWWENLGASGWAQHFVVQSYDGASSVFAGDMDGDGDSDLLGTAYNQNEVTWGRNLGGQFGLATGNLSATYIEPGNREVLMAIEVSHNGIPGDSDMELTRLAFLFEETEGDPLTTTEVNRMIDRLWVYYDLDGDGVFNASNDYRIINDGWISLDGNGVLDYDFSPTSTRHLQLTQVWPENPKTCFLVADTQADAMSYSPNQFRMTHLTEPGGPSRSAAEDRKWRIPLRMEYLTNVTTGIVYVTNATPTPTRTPTTTATGTPTLTPTVTYTPTVTSTPTASPTPTNTPIGGPIPTTGPVGLLLLIGLASLLLRRSNRRR